MLSTDNRPIDESPADEAESREALAANAAALRIMAENMQAARSRVTDMGVLYSLETLVTGRLMPQDAVNRLVNMVQPASLPDMAFRLLD